MIDIISGLNFKHRDESFAVFVKEVNKESNELKVTVHSNGGKGYCWPETWNLAHTISGFNDGTYVKVGL